MNRILILIVMVMSLASCKKYADDNTVVSLRKPETRLIKKWHVSYVVDNGEEVSSNFKTYYYNFQADKRVVLQYTDIINGEEVPTVEYGNWRFTNADTRLEVNFDNFYTDYEILELTSKRLSLRSENLLANRTLYMVVADR